MPLKTPLLFMVFNRPDPTRRVFEEIRRAQPERLFIAADGPRPDHPEDALRCAEVRDIVSRVDWTCDVRTRFQDNNLGCKYGASSAVTWFFDNVEEGIILEDDCLPDQTFFLFCREMLEHFREDERIAMISGYNVCGRYESPYSYTFTKYGHLWGWASWRRSWKNYDITMEVWEDADSRRRIRQAMHDRRQWNYHEWMYEETYHGRKGTWDYQWESYRLLHGQLSVTPSINMIENLGFGADATHTTQKSSSLILPAKQMEFPIVHNPIVAVDERYDWMLRPKSHVPSLKVRRFKEWLRKMLSSF